MKLSADKIRDLLKTLLYTGINAPYTLYSERQALVEEVKRLQAAETEKNQAIADLSTAHIRTVQDLITDRARMKEALLVAHISLTAAPKCATHPELKNDDTHREWWIGHYITPALKKVEEALVPAVSG